MNEWKPTPDAEAELRRKLEYYPDDYLANYMLGFITSGERKYEESNKYLLAASKILPSAPEPFLYLGLNAFSQDKMNVAEKMLRKAVELTGSDEARSNYQIRRAYVDLARILARAGRREGKRCIRRQSPRAGEQDNGGKPAERLGHYAFGWNRRSRRCNASEPSTGRPGRAVGTERHRPVRSQQNFSRTARRSRSEREDLRSVLALAFNDLATSQAMRGGYSLALSHYQEAEQWDSALPGLEKNLGQCAFRAKELSGSDAWPFAGIEEQRDSPPLRAMLGVSYFATDQYAKRRQHLLRWGTGHAGQ